MTEFNEDDVPTELELLKKRADDMGLKYHHKIGKDKLKKMVNEALENEPEEAEVVAHNPLTETKHARHSRLRKDARRLIRCNIVCNNPNKKGYDGEYFTAGNSVVGLLTKFAKYNTTEGYHIPNVIYKYLLTKQCQIFQTASDKRGNKTRKGKLINEFNIQVLDNLTKKELIELARRQSAAGTVGK